LKAVKTVVKMSVRGKTGRGGPKKRWLDTIVNDNVRAVGMRVRDVES